jgi:hypothetical protein
MKHHRWSKPKMRLIWMDNKLETIYWRDSKDPETNFKG